MGILNITPDSFSDGGKYNSVKSGFDQLTKLISDGADIIDIGGESTRPGFTPVSEEDEIKRILPFVKEAVKSGAVVSVDTFKEGTAKAALENGAQIINCVYDIFEHADLAKLCVKYGASLIITHSSVVRGDMGIVFDVADYFEKSVEFALDLGIQKEKIMLDPGIGFNKTFGENLELLKGFAKFNKFSLPILHAVSNKSVIGGIINEPIENRTYGTMAAITAGVQMGVGAVRVHNVAAAVQVCKVADEIYKNS